MDKTGLRSRMRKVLRDLPPLVRAQEEELVNAAVMADPAWARAETVLVFAAKAPELSVTSLTNAAFTRGRRVVFPRADGERLLLHEVRAWTELAPGAFGIREPAASALPVEPADVDAVVVPGLAWTRQGDRLGQGGGHYDRLLAGAEARTFGVGFGVQLVDLLPVEGHDVRVERVVTPHTLTET